MLPKLGHLLGSELNSRWCGIFIQPTSQMFHFSWVWATTYLEEKLELTTLVLIFKGHSYSALLVLTLIHPQILNGFDP